MCPGGGFQVLEVLSRAPKIFAALPFCGMSGLNVFMFVEMCFPMISMQFDVSSLARCRGSTRCKWQTWMSSHLSQKWLTSSPCLGHIPRASASLSTHIPKLKALRDESKHGERELSSSRVAVLLMSFAGFEEGQLCRAMYFCTIRWARHLRPYVDPSLPGCFNRYPARPEAIPVGGADVRYDLSPGDVPKAARFAFVVSHFVSVLIQVLHAGHLLVTLYRAPKGMQKTTG